MQPLKILLGLLIAYVLTVVGFESLIGYFQPANASTLTVTTTAADGATNPRVVSRLASAGNIYVAANHWPRAWYEQARSHPQVQARIDGETGDYLAVPVVGVEHDQVDADNPLGPFFRFLTGFPPRYFLRLDPA